jgi:hypothetical protein
MFPNWTHDGFKWLDLLRSHTYDIKEYTATVDLPSLSANATIIQNVTVTGVNVGDWVLDTVNPTFTDDFQVTNAKVTAADTITMQVHRGKAGSYDPPSETYTFLVLKNTR